MGGITLLAPGTHSAAPDRPLLLTLAAPLVAGYDRLRDRLQGRPRT